MALLLPLLLALALVTARAQVDNSCSLGGAASFLPPPPPPRRRISAHLLHVPREAHRRLDGRVEGAQALRATILRIPDLHPIPARTNANALVAGARLLRQV
eukprot:805631-Prymnesium_polylepis.1